MMETTGIVTEVERYAIHDGTGIRTTIFLKGCPLRCRWCSNPETHLFAVEPGYTAEKCRHCGKCRAVCDWIQETPEGLVFPREHCRSRCPDACRCAKACLYGALKQVGEERTVASLVAEVSRDISFYDATGGGVTISGGEPMSQAAFAIELLKGMKALYIDTAMESCGAGAVADYRLALPYLDTLFLDVKSTDADKFQQWAGYPLERLLEHIRAISEMAKATGTSLFLRTPVIRGFNDDKKEMEGIAAFAAALPHVSGIELLPYHKLGRGKYAIIGRSYLLGDLEPPGDEEMEELRQICKGHGLPVVAF